MNVVVKMNHFKAEKILLRKVQNVGNNSKVCTLEMQVREDMAVREKTKFFEERNYAYHAAKQNEVWSKLKTTILFLFILKLFLQFKITIWTGCVI